MPGRRISQQLGPDRSAGDVPPRSDRQQRKSEASGKVEDAGGLRLCLQPMHPQQIEIVMPNLSESLYDHSRSKTGGR